MENELVLVTGATGKAGNEIVRQLVQIDYKVRAAFHTRSKGENLKAYNVELIELDFNNISTYKSALKHVNKIIFIGTVAPEFSVVSHQFALAAKESGVNHIVKLSAFGALYAPEFMIAASHRESELAIENIGIPFTHLRPNIFMQNFINYYINDIQNDEKIYLPYGEGRISFIDLRDVASVAIEVLNSSGKHSGKGYNLTGSEAITFYEAAEILSENTGRNIEYIDISEEEAISSMHDEGFYPPIIEININFARFAKAGGFAPITNEFEMVMRRKPILFRKFAEDFSHTFR